jgi:N-acetylglucosamine-6-phosphate deacetylase
MKAIEHMQLYIRASQVLTPARVLSNAAVLIEGGKIAAVAAARDLKRPARSTLIDASSLIAAPGYIDWQLNGGFGFDFAEQPHTIWDVAARLPEHGVTAFLPTIITQPLNKYDEAMAVLKCGAPQGFIGAQPLGLHFEGPYLNPGKKGAHNPAYLRKPSVAEIKNWSRANGVWLVTLAPEQAGAHEMIRALIGRGVVVSAGHSLATYDQAQQAFAAGVTGATHLFNAMPALDHRAPGLAVALLQAPRVKVGLIPDGVHAHPAMVALAWRLKGKRGIAIVTDAIGALGMPPGQYNLGDFTVNVDEVSVRLADGTLAGSNLRMDAAVRNLCAFTGCSLADAVTSASATVARLIGTRRKGALRKGADADVVLLDSSGQVMATIIKGAVAYSRLG